MRRFIPIIVAIVLGVVTVSAQQLPGKCSVWYPEILAKSAVIKESDLKVFAKGGKYGQGSMPANPKHWVVYSDRDNNTTYKSPGGAPTNTPLAMNEQVRIAQIQGDYALVYAEPRQSIDYPKISSEAQASGCKGWIPMQNLLLWHSCPADKHGIYQKALICANLDVTGGKNRGNLYLNPDNLSNCESLSSEMQFYFIMKKVGDLALLADVHSMDGTSNEVLYGWVHKQDYVPWNQRTCLEPTWDHEAVDFFTSKDYAYNFYKRANVKEDPIVGQKFEKKPATRYSKYLHRMAPELLRYPLLDGSTETMYNVSTFATMDGGNVSDVAERKAKANAKQEKVTKEMTNINIGIVIDGTRSMDKYYESVVKAVQNSLDYFGENRKVKIGALIYRDYTDGAYCTEAFPLTSGYKNVYDWLMKGGDYGIKSSQKDLTYEEALYAGMNAALDKLGFNPKQSNIMLVIGDCGNDSSDTNFTQEQIINKLISKNVQIMSFQVRNEPNPAFNNFNNQMCNIMKQTLTALYHNLDETMVIKTPRTADGYVAKNNLDSYLYIGSHSQPWGVPELSLDRLENLIISSIGEYSRSVENRISAMVSVGFRRSSNSSGSSGSSMVLDEKFVRSQLGDDEETLEMLKQQNVLLTFEGYTPKEFEARQVYKPVIFISGDELTTLIAELAPINSSAAVSDHNNRAPYVEAMISLLARQTGIPIEKKNEIMRMSPAELQQNIFGLNAPSEALSKHTLEEIASPDEVGSSEYSSLVIDFQNKYENLLSIKQSGYKYFIKMNGITYYWIPVEELP